MWKTGIGRDHRQRAVGVAQHQDRVGPLCGQHCVAGDDHLADRLGRRLSRRLQAVVGPAQAQLLEEDAVQFVVVVLAGVDDHLVGRPVERRHHP
jgi:hypothetical protein